MALTPSVGTGQIITPAWGNEIRDRSNQLFATKAELDAGWPSAPVGSWAWLTTPRTLMVKVAGGWEPYAQRGTANMVWPGGTPNAALTVTFPVAFTVAPFVVASGMTAGGNMVLNVEAVTITTAKFTSRFTTDAVYAGTLPFAWMALGG